MGIRNLDPDDDYSYDRTNQSGFVKEMEAKARRCLRYEPHPRLHGICRLCNGPRYEHSLAAREFRKGPHVAK